MQAVIVAGGKGSRLRPLTLTTPKPLLPLLEVPYLDWLISRCVAVGLNDILISVGYRGEQIVAHCGEGERYGAQIRYIREDQPLDTAGALLLAQPYFSGEPLVVFNADILADFPLEVMIAAHRSREAVGTLSLTRVADITAYGLVETDPSGRILAFREKPSAAEAAHIMTNTINAGAYILDPSIFKSYTVGEPLSFERTVFPELLRQHQPLYAYIHEGYWRDLGTPQSYYLGQLDILNGKIAYSSSATVQTPGLWIHPSATIDPAAQLNAPCYIGAHCYLGPKAIIPAGTVLQQQCWVNTPLAPGVYSSGSLMSAT